MGIIVGVVGAGNMGAALVRGWSRAADAGISVLVYDVIQERAAELASNSRVTVAASAGELAHEAQVVLVAVKPKDVVTVLEDIRGRLGKGTIVVSAAAGVTVAALRKAAGAGPAVFRIMPNLGVELGEGVVAVATEPDTSPEAAAVVGTLLAPLGLVESIPEEQFDAVTAVSGSSIGFLALVLEGMEDGAVRTGMPRTTARAFIRQTVLAGALLLQRHTGSAADVKDRVSSPAGTTIAGLATLEDYRVRAAFVRAIEQAAERSRCLQDAGRPILNHSNEG